MSDRVPIIFYGLQLTPPYLVQEGTAWKVNADEYRKYFSAIKRAGVDIVRTLPWETWTPRPEDKRSQFQPYTIIGDRYDLSTPDPSFAYWTAFRSIIQAINDVGLEVRFCWLDQCDHVPPWSQYSPWISNVQEITSFYDQAAFPFVKSFIETAIDRFSGLKVSWAWGNETNDKAGMLAICRSVIYEIIRTRNLDFNKMTYGATAVSGKYVGKTPTRPYPYVNDPPNTQDTLKGDVDHVFGEKSKLDMYKEVHSCGDPALDAERPFGDDLNFAVESWGRHDIRWVASDDGVLRKIDL